MAAALVPTTAAEQFTLRPYQREAIDAITQAWARGINRPAVQLSTGLGKTVIFSRLIAEHLAEHGGRAVVLVHREELATQAADKLARTAPDLTVGIVKAERDDTHADVVICSVPTLARQDRRERITDVSLVVADECHHSAARTWRDAIEHFGCFDTTPTAGFSATLQRSDNLSLGDIWQEVVYERGLLWAIRNGHLTDVRGIRVGLDMDLTKVQTRGGDYTEAGLEQAMHAAGAADVIARGYAVHAAGRKGISFAPSVAMAAEIGDALNFAGIRTETITGTTTSQERTAIYRRFERGETQVLSSVMVLTEGFDEPSAEVAIMARPTKSQSLYTQMAGRVLRLHPGKESALLLDVCGVSEDHDLSACLPDLAGKEGGGRRLEPRDGESLLEATERQEREPVAPPQPLRSREIDLFAGRGRIWLETAGGVPFLPAGKNEAGRDQYAAVNPAIGGYVVDLITRGRQQALSTHDNSQDAIRAAERFAAEQDGPPNLKSSAWRQRPASSKHLAFTRRLGVPLPDGVTAGQCSDAVAVILASKLIDRVAPAADRQAS